MAQVSLTVRSGLGMRRMLDLDFAEHLYGEVWGVRGVRTSESMFSQKLANGVGCLKDSALPAYRGDGRRRAGRDRLRSRLCEEPAE